MEKDGIYFGRRAQEEREAARNSTNRIVRQRHLEFADAYDYRAREVTALEEQLIIQPVQA
jgi:hypothetical protein